MSQSCKTERETCGKDCVSAVYALSMNRVYIYIIYYISYFHVIIYLFANIYNDILSILLFQLSGDFYAWD